MRSSGGSSPWVRARHDDGTSKPATASRSKSFCRAVSASCANPAGRRSVRRPTLAPKNPSCVMAQRLSMCPPDCGAGSARFSTFTRARSSTTFPMISRRTWPRCSSRSATASVARKGLRVKGVRGRDYQSVEEALRLIASRRYPLERIRTHEFQLEQADQALRVQGERTDPSAIHVTVVPRAEGVAPAGGNLSLRGPQGLKQPPAVTGHVNARFPLLRRPVL